MNNDTENDKFAKFKKSVETSLMSFTSKLGESLKEIRSQINEIKADLDIKEHKEC